MADSRVDTIARLAQWKVDNFGPCSYKKSDPFKLGIWNWYLSIERNRYLCIHLFPEPSLVSKDHPPIARFVLTVSNTSSSRRVYISPITSRLYKEMVTQVWPSLLCACNAAVHERVLRTCDDFVWPVDTTFLGRFIIDVEFLDLKICPLNGGEASSIWPCDGKLQSVAAQSSLQCLSRMLNDAIHADLTIITSDGTLRAHKAVLCASSLVFQEMFHQNGEKKESSAIHIEDMSLESCMTLLCCLYGTIKQEDFLKHRLALLGAADKFDIGDLKDACEESLLEDLNSENVLERLNEAWLYQLHKLKKGCFTFLFDFGKVYDVRDEMNTFLLHADRKLMLEIFQEVLTIWKPV